MVNPKKIGMACGVGLLMAAGVISPARADYTPLGPTPYLSFADSPFNGTSFGWFYLEDAEDGAINTPGMAVISNTPSTTVDVFGPGVNTDSVDGDDGTIDGSGAAGHVISEIFNQPTDNLGFTITFNAGVLGSLPTHVGVVWTDGNKTAPTQVQFFGPSNELLGTIGPVHISDNSFAGTTGEDRFFGAINTDGISYLVIRDPGGNNSIEVDHIQYGIIPEPATLMLITAGALTLMRRTTKRQAAGRQTFN